MKLQEPVIPTEWQNGPGTLTVSKIFEVEDVDGKQAYLEIEEHQGKQNWEADVILWNDSITQTFYCRPYPASACLFNIHVGGNEEAVDLANELVSFLQENTLDDVDDFEY